MTVIALICILASRTKIERNIHEDCWFDYVEVDFIIVVVVLSRFDSVGYSDKLQFYTNWTLDLWAEKANSKDDFHLWNTRVIRYKRKA